MPMVAWGGALRRMTALAVAASGFLIALDRAP
jgi:hypothetical protein